MLRQTKRPNPLQAASKSIWKERYTQNFSFYCPLCSCPRRIGMHPEPGQPIHFFQVFVASAFFTLITWSVFDWKGLVSFVPFWIAFEIFYRAKVRASVACQRCGFDPVLYLVDLDRARAAVETHWRAKFEEKGIAYPSKTPSQASASSAPHHMIHNDALSLESSSLDSSPPTP